MSDNEDNAPDSQAWLATFGDLITLLMTFFVLILSFSTMNVAKFMAALDSFENAFGASVKVKIMENDGVLEMADPLAITSVPGGVEKPPYFNPNDTLYEEVVEYMTQSKFAQFLQIKKAKQGYVIKIASDAFFGEGSSRLKEEHLEVLDRLAELVRLFPNYISIEGHIGKDFTPTDEFSSGMDLSIARSVSVCQYFLKQGISPNRLGIAGYGSYRSFSSDVQGLPDSIRDGRIEITLLNVQKDD
jgi:chemotaxis protein MotB